MEAARVRAANASEVVCAAWASELVRGVAWLEDVGAKWVRPHRFWPEQERALGSCAAWYPGIYRQMAPCCAGVRLEFETDASELVLEIALDAEPAATSRVLAGVAEKGLLAPGAHDALTVDVDGKRLEDVPLDGVEPPAEHGPRGSEVAFELAAGAASGDLLQLPGFADASHVCVWLPALRGARLGRVRGNGTFLRPTGRDVPARRLLVLGDSVAQGFVCDSPAASWPSIIARERGLELVNQSVGGQVYQPSALVGLDRLDAPDVVIVALGANYSYGRSSVAVVSREVTEYLSRVDALWPDASLLVMVPPADGKTSVPGSCYPFIGKIIGDAVVRVSARRVSEGRAAVYEVMQPELGEELLSDADGHPTAEGARILAGFVGARLDELLECTCLRDFGQFGRCGACLGTAATPEDAIAGEQDDDSADTIEDEE